MLAHPFIQKLKNQLNKPLPGTDAQFEMAHVNRTKINYKDLQKGNYRSSAVLVLLLKREEHFYIPLTERHIYKGAHSGQISLPGGKKEDSDPTLEVTALRECHEEIGLKSNISILGALTPVYIPVSNFIVNPFVGIYNETEINYALNKNEVKNLLELNIDDLRKPELVKETTVSAMNGVKLKTPYFDVQGKIVWGATAMILNEFKKLI